MRNLLAAFLLCTSFLATVDAAERKPNVILILADDLGLPALGCTGGVYKTPHLDALAAGGTRFEYCFAAPLCAPSRAMLMTGRYAFHTGVADNGLGTQATPEKDGSIALRLKEAGYSTAVAGKWRQLSHFTTKADGAKWGFDEFLIWGAALPDDEGEGKPAKKQKQTGKATKPDRYWDPDYNLNGKTILYEEKYGPDILNDFVIDFVRRHKQEPFFVYYPTPLIHSPILKTPDSPATAAEKLKNKKDADNSGPKSLYADNVTYLDKLIGKLVAELDALKIRDQTLVVFVGDNGSVPIGTVGGKTIDGKKNTLLEGGSRVPCIANWPGTTPAGVVSKNLVDFSDMLPTFAELAGVKPSDDREIDGRSFAPQLRGEKGSPREWAYVHLRGERYVRSANWKLNAAGELFDMRDAPYQQILVPADTTNADAIAARKSLQAALDGPLKAGATTAATRKQKKATQKKAATTSS